MILAIRSVWTLLAVCGFSSFAVAAERIPVVAEPPTVPAAAAEPAGSVKLVYRFAPHQSVQYRVDQEESMTVQSGSTKETTRNESHIQRRFRVASVDAAGVATLELYIDRAALSNQFNDDQPRTFDSTLPGPPPAGFEAIGASIGKLLGTMRVDRQGKVLSLASNLPRARDEKGGDEASQNFLIALPEQPVKVGDGWHDDFDIKVQVTRTVNQRVRMRRQYLIEEIHDGVASIRMRTSELTPVSEPHLRAQLLQMTPEAVVKFDVARGLIVARAQKSARTEINVIGPGSLMSATMRLDEKLIEPDQRTASSSDAKKSAK